MFPGFTFLIPGVLSPKTAFHALSKPLVNCRLIVGPCYLFHGPALIPAPSNAAVSKVRGQCVPMSRVSTAEHRAFSGNLPISWQLWESIDLWKAQAWVWAKRPSKSTYFWQYTKVNLNLDFMQAYLLNVWDIKREVCLLLQLRLCLCKYGLLNINSWFYHLLRIDIGC